METENKFSLVCTAKNKSRNKKKGKIMVSLYIASSYKNTEPKPFLALQNVDSYCSIHQIKTVPPTLIQNVFPDSLGSKELE